MERSAPALLAILLLAFVASWVHGADFPPPPGVVIDHVPASSGQYVGSPSIAILPDGSYVAFHDLFGPKSTELVRAVGRMFRSTDRGEHWTPATELNGAFWCGLFVHRGKLYLMGTTKQMGDMVIRRSEDGGKTWTEPKDAGSGLLAAGRYHTSSVPVVEHGGRVWRAIECDTGNRDFQAFVMSAPAEADLQNAGSWTFSTRLSGNSTWLEGKFGGWLEGNAVIAPDGSVLDILRCEYRVGAERAAVVHVSPDGKTGTFDPSSDFISFPGGCKKFTIRFDNKSKLYWTLSNAPHPDDRGKNLTNDGLRNTLVLMSSADALHWTVRATILHHPDSVKHAFQYVDWQFDGEDLVVASRTAWDDAEGGAHSAHDANYLTFHRIEKFRDR
jgi:hypothetical protein